MFDFLMKRKTLQLDEVAELLKTRPELVKAFENAYSANALDDSVVPENLFEVNAKQAAAQHAGIVERPEEVEAMINKIVDELVAETKVWKYDGNTTKESVYPALPEGSGLITNAQINALPMEMRPQLTSNLMKIDIAEPSHLALLEMYNGFMTSRSEIGRAHV